MSEPDEKTPTEIPVANPAHRGLVRALHNHGLVLEATRARVEEMRDNLASRVDTAETGEVARLGKVFRDEGDSAHDLAREAEKFVRTNGHPRKL